MCLALLILGIACITPATAPPADAETFVFECDGVDDIVVQTADAGAWVFLPSGTVHLKHQPAASGSKYSDGAMTYWNKGDSAVFELGETVHRDCKDNRAKAIWEAAKLGGVDFRAVGNEPGWHLELRDGGQSLLVSDYGERQFEFTTPEPETDWQAKTTHYRAKSGSYDVVVVIRNRPCGDSMSGESFEASVRVRVGGRLLLGCGRALH